MRRVSSFQFHVSVSWCAFESLHGIFQVVIHLLLLVSSYLRRSLSDRIAIVVIMDATVHFEGSSRVIKRSAKLCDASLRP